MLDWEIEAKDVTNRTGTMAGTGTTRTITLTHTTPVVPGSLTVTAGTVTGTDNGDGGVGGTGVTDADSTVDYLTGAVTVVFATAPSAQPTVTYQTFETLDSRDIRDIGDTPATLRVRNKEDAGGIILQVSDDRSTWISLFKRSVEAWEVPDCGRTSVRFMRVYASAKCRVFGSHLNLQ